MGRKSSDKNWTVRIRDKQLQLKGKNGDFQKIDFSLPESSAWTGQVCWHPDSSCFAAFHKSNHPIREVHLVQSSPEEQLQPLHETYPYPKPGDPLNHLIPVLFKVDRSKPIPIDPSLIPNIQDLENFRWHQEGHRFWFTYTERGFGKFRLIEIDLDTGTQRIRAKEESEKFIYVHGNTSYLQLENKDQLLWRSEKSGHLHLYLLDGKTGEEIRPLTSGKWIVRNLLGIDEKTRIAFLEIAGYYQNQDPYYRHFASVNLDNGDLTLLTEADGDHEIFFSPDRHHYVAKWSRIDHPPVYEVRKTSTGTKIATLNQPDLSPLLAAGWQVPQAFVSKDRNDKHDIYGAIYRPTHFDPTKKYPVIENIYAGPHGHFAPKQWSAFNRRYQEIAEAGFIVVELDGLGTNGRSRDFHQVAYQNLKDSGFPTVSNG